MELGDYRFVVMNTKKKRQLADSKYNERRAQCEKALEILQNSGVKIADLCSLTMKEFEDCGKAITDPLLFARARHCISENERVLQAVSALKAGNLVQLGELLKASHKSLKDDYEVTGIELDTLADTANAQEGCLGARMTGAGFGGCAIALVHKDKIQNFIANVQKKYTETVGHDAGFFACSSGDGVKEITNDL